VSDGVVSDRAISALHRLGIKIVMLTDDNAETAARVAEKLGIDRIEPASRLTKSKW
jgi:P-type E1-E2 ATPase